MTSNLHELLLESNSLLHVSSTGAGPTLQLNLWATPGASEYLVGFFTPYAKTQLHSFLGHLPKDSYVSKEVSYDLAMASYIRASEHKAASDSKGNPIGVGITAAVASTRMPRGHQQAYICIITQDSILSKRLEFKKCVGEASRRAQDEALAKYTLKFLEQALEGNKDQEAEHYALARFYKYPVFETNGTRSLRSSGGNEALYLPATLNPIHDGHRTMAQTAEDYLSGHLPGKVKARYLVSSSSPHKGSLAVQEMLFKAGMLRAERWKGHSRMVEFTHDEPLFIDKARKRPGSIFLIGSDTMERMLDPKWGPEIDSMFQEMKNLGVKFLVMGREINGEFKTCRDIPVPWPHGNLFEPLPGRVDLSSTKLRTRD